MLSEYKKKFSNLPFNTKLTLNNFALVAIIYFICFAFVFNYVLINNSLELKSRFDKLSKEHEVLLGDLLYHGKKAEIDSILTYIGSQFEFDLFIFVYNRSADSIFFDQSFNKSELRSILYSTYENSGNSLVAGDYVNHFLRTTSPSITQWFHPKYFMAKQIDPLLAFQFIDVLYYGEDNNGFIKVRYPLTEILKPLKQLIAPVISVITISVIFLIVLAKIFVKSITGPLGALHGASQKVSTLGDYSVRAEKFSEDEIGKLVDSFNSMLHQIQVKSNDLETEKEKVEAINAQLLVNQARLKIMTYELSKLEEKERHKLGEELHDGICQLLVISKMRMSELVDTGMVQDSQDTRDLIDMIGDAVKYTRTLLFELSSPILYELGLEPAIEKLAEDFQNKHNLQVTVDCTGFSAELVEEKRIFLFRSIRELLINIVKHAECNSAEVKLISDAESIYVEVIDTGRGFDDTAVNEKKMEGARFGLFGIRERIGYLGGKVWINSTKGQGSKVKLMLPISEEHGIEYNKNITG